jgi:site-specific recombinase XerD
MRLHDLRHTAATRGLKKGGNLKTVQKMLGHKSILTTERYAKTQLEDVAGAMD